MKNGEVQVGLIGAGHIGRVHAANLSLRIPGVRIAAVTDVQREAAQEIANQYNIGEVADRADEIFRDPEVDAVLICTPADTHVELIAQAAAAGKQIFCEKPISHSLEEADRALAAVRADQVRLQIGFNRRFDSNFARVRKAITDGEVGRPIHLHIFSRDPAPPSIDYIRSSGGIFLDMTIHDFDMVRFLMGEEPEEIYAAGSVMTDPEIGSAGDFDSVLIVLRFGSGAVAVIDNARRASYGYDQRVEVFGSVGKIETGNCYPNQATISDAASVRRDLPLYFFMERYTESFVQEMREFVAAVRDRKPVPVTGLDGRAAVVLALAAQRSCDEHRPVKLECL